MKYALQMCWLSLINSLRLTNPRKYNFSFEMKFEIKRKIDETKWRIWKK